jgi:hypothetical protein
MRRGAFRLHPGTISEERIILAHVTDFMAIRNALLRTRSISVRNSDLQAYGTTDVIHAGAKNYL